MRNSTEDKIRKLNKAVTLSLGKEILRSQAGSIENIREELPAISLLINMRHTLRSGQTRLIKNYCK